MGSKRSSQNSVAKDCAARVMETIPLMMRFIRKDMREQNKTFMSVPQFRTLAFVDRHPGASLSDLAEHLGVTRATASTTVERLVQDELVLREENPEERRRVLLTLTKTGKQRLQKTRETTRNHIAEFLATLPEEQISQIEAGLFLLKEVFEPTEFTLPPK
ncbi:MAG: MarR family transcriptional regulator [Plectolyngbya sp. WJT66-NPBG17]|jgi:DNA-binding MarR family transcriptional regulator|nr:MarR family transcriptional regulator [Plectolyngbya sp. WJT66-NPBG17]